MIVDVAEFKQIAQKPQGPTTVKNLTNQGKLQVQAYINILGLKSGHLIVEEGDAQIHYEVFEDVNFDRKLKDRLVCFNEMSDFVDK